MSIFVNSQGEYATVDDEHDAFVEGQDDGKGGTWTKAGTSGGTGGQDTVGSSGFASHFTTPAWRDPSRWQADLDSGGVSAVPTATATMQYKAPDGYTVWVRPGLAQALWTDGWRPTGEAYEAPSVEGSGGLLGYPDLGGGADTRQPEDIVAAFIAREPGMTSTEAERLLTALIGSDAARRMLHDTGRVQYPEFAPVDLSSILADEAAREKAEEDASLEMARALREAMAAGVGGGNVAGTEGLSGPYTQYLRARGLTGLPGTAAERYTGQLFDPIRNLYNVNQQIGAARAFGEYGEETGVGLPSMPDWQSYVRSFDLGRAPIRTKALETLRRLGGTGAEDRSATGLTFERKYDPETGEAISGTGGLGNLQSLIRSGLASAYGGLGAAYIANRLPQTRDRYEMQRAQGVPGLSDSFLGYLQNKLGY